MFYVGLVRKPTPPALGPPSKLHAELLFPAAATLEPSVHQSLKVCPPATEGMICSASHSLWLLFFWFHILHLTVVCHDSINIIRKPSPWPGCTHVFDCVCTSWRDACRSRVTSARHSKVIAITSTSTRSSLFQALRQLSTRHWHQQQATRGGRFESGGARLAIIVVPTTPPDAVAACAWPCFRRSVPTSDPCCQKK